MLSFTSVHIWFDDPWTWRSFENLFRMKVQFIIYSSDLNRREVIILNNTCIRSYTLLDFFFWVSVFVDWGRGLICSMLNGETLNDSYVWLLEIVMFYTSCSAYIEHTRFIYVHNILEYAIMLFNGTSHWSMAWDFFYLLIYGIGFLLLLFHIIFPNLGIKNTCCPGIININSGGVLTFLVTSGLRSIPSYHQGSNICSLLLFQVSF